MKVNPLRPLIITIPSVKKDYQLKGTSKEDIDGWIEAIKNAGAIIEEIDTSNSPHEVKRKSSGLLSSLKRNGHSRKRSISDTSLIKENEKAKETSKDGSSSNIDLTTSIREEYTQQQQQQQQQQKQLLRPASIYDLHLKPIDPFSPVILPVNQFNCNYLISDEASSSTDYTANENDNDNDNDNDVQSFNESHTDNTVDNHDDNPDSFTYSSSSELQIQIPVLVEYYEPEEENILI